MTFMQKHFKNITYNVHNNRHSNISEHKATRTKLEYKKLLLIRNMEHISYNDFLATIDDGN